MTNPFTIVFGRKPTEMIERFPQRHEILENFTSPNANQQLYIITGVRGSGKTVLMTSIAETLRQDKDWIVIELNPELDLLNNLASKLSNHVSCQEWFRKAGINLSYLGFGIEISGEPPITDLETAIVRMLESIRKHKKRVLITIDEVTNTQQMRVFAASFQILIRQDLPVFLLMTGLYENIYELQNQKSLTFLFRAPNIKLSALDMTAIKIRYKNIFDLDDEAAVEMTKLTGGYPFAFQLLGYLTWNNKGNYPGVLPEYKQYLYEYVYNKIWHELSEKDRQILYGMVEARDDSVQAIKTQLKLSDNEWNPYRQRLIRKGVADGSQRGVLKLTLPLFDEFIKEKKEFEA